MSSASTTIWPLVRIGDILTYLDERIDLDEAQEYITITVKRRHGGLEERERLLGHQIVSKKQFRMVPGAFIISRVQCWHEAYAMIPPDVPPNMIASANYDQFAVSPHVDPRFFWWLSHSPHFRETVRNSAFGVVIEKMVFNRNAWLDKVLPLPSLEEQRRIVKRVEELASKLSEARTIRHETEEATKALIATVSEKGFSEIRSTEPLGELIAEGTAISYGVLVPGPEVENGIPFIRIQDLCVSDPPVRPSKRISPEVESSYARTRLEGGEVLLAVVGATIGKIGVVPDSWRGANIARAVCRIVPGPKLDRDFLVYVLLSQKVQNYFRTVTRTLAQPTLNIAQVQQTRIPLPSLAEQRRIVAHLNGLQEQTDALKALQKETSTELDAFVPSILDKAFRGQL